MTERRARILDEVGRRGSATVAELSEILGVSGMTVRRDLDALAQRGAVEKVHGGATVRHGHGPGPRAAVGTGALVEEKRAVAALAATLVEPGMSVGLSSGSTTLALAHALLEVPHLTIVTNSLRIADIFQRPGDETYSQTVVLTGGVRTPADALVGPVAVRALEHLHCDVVMIGVHGIDRDAGFTTPNLLEAETNRAFIGSGRSVSVVADHTKWGRVGLTTVVDLDAVDRVVVDAGLADGADEELRSLVRELWVAPLPGDVPTPGI